MADRPRVVAKTADYTIKPAFDRPDTCFTNMGATGAVVFTLPTPTRQLLGVSYYFRGIADQDVTVATAVADTMITLNDVAADSVGATTTSEQIGSYIGAQCIESASNTYKWVVNGLAVGHTYSVVTA